MEANLVVEGLKFMALGMGTVFLFLVVLIFMMNMQAKVIQRFFPEPKEGAVAVTPTKQAPQTQESKNNKVAAIVAAIIEDKKNS